MKMFKKFIQRIIEAKDREDAICNVFNKNSDEFQTKFCKVADINGYRDF